MLAQCIREQLVCTVRRTAQWDCSLWSEVWGVYMLCSDATLASRRSTIASMSWPPTSLSPTTRAAHI